MKLGYDTYSIRGLKWKAPRLIDYAAELKLDTLQIGSLDEYESLDEAYLRARREQAERAGILIDQGTGCISPTSPAWNPKNGAPEQHLLKAVSVAKAVGSKSLRVFIASPEIRRSGPPIQTHAESTIAVLRKCRGQILDSGVKVAIENHGDFTAREMRSLIEAAGKEYVGVCLDTGNPLSVMEDPALTVEVLAPYAVSSHFRDSVVYEHPRGAAFQWVAAGDGCVSLDQVCARFKTACPQAPVHFEVITGRPPYVLPYLEEEFWKPYSAMLSADFARFVRLVKQGRPFAGAMMIAAPGKQPPAYEAALLEQQRLDLERSLQFARKNYGLGEKSAA